jgi:hypothetical protein
MEQVEQCNILIAEIYDKLLGISLPNPQTTKESNDQLP